MAGMLQQRGTGGVPGESLNLKVAPKGRVALEEASSQQLFSSVFLTTLALSPGSQTPEG